MREVFGANPAVGVLTTGALPRGSNGSRTRGSRPARCIAARHSPPAIGAGTHGCTQRIVLRCVHAVTSLSI
ncbi:MAG TPA: hypothetical protein VFU13_07395 [Steroidobacteraceae bacterium]|nr:hypothetical protein [Steroidobacteraceae bacterium]